MKKTHLIPCAALALAMCALPLSAAAAPSYQEAEEQQLDKSIEEALVLYDAEVEAIAENNMGGSEEFTLTLDPIAKLMFGQMLPVDISWLDSASLKADVSLGEDDILEYLQLLLNDTSVLNANIDMNMTDEALYMQLPDLSEKFIRMLFSEMETAQEDAEEEFGDDWEEGFSYSASTQLSGEQIAALLTFVRALPENLPATADVGALLERYGKLIISHLPDAESTPDNLDVEGISQECVKYDVDLSSKDFFDIVIDFMQTLKSDEDLKTMIVDICGGDTTAYDQLISSVDGFLEENADMDPESLPDDALLTMNVWYDENAQSVAGRQITMHDEYNGDTTLVCAYPSNDEGTALYLAMNQADTNLVFYGTGTVDGDLLAGTYHLYMGTFPLADVTVTDWNVSTAVRGQFNGAIKITPSVMPIPEDAPEELTGMMSFIQDFSVDIELMNDPAYADWTIALNYLDTPCASLNAKVDTTEAPELEPVPEDAEIISASDEEAMAEYQSEIDLSAITEKLLAAGMPEEAVAEMFGAEDAGEAQTELAG